MSQPSGISRRLQQCLKHMQSNDSEGALVNLYPVIDKTAKKRRTKEKKVGLRIKSFLEDEEILISAIGTGNVLARISVNDVSITDALYKFGRNAIAHEGELDPRLNFNESGLIEIGFERWNLPIGYIFGMCVAVIVAPENRQERVSEEIHITLFGQQFLVNELWGQKKKVRDLICNRFRNPQLFEKV